MMVLAFLEVSAHPNQQAIICGRTHLYQYLVVELLSILIHFFHMVSNNGTAYSQTRTNTYTSVLS